MRDIFVGIDGTTQDWYKNIRFQPWDFEYSFINMFYKYSSAGEGDKIHIPGPDLWGKGTVECISSALTFLSQRMRVGGSFRIIVAGYSRGAYAALRVAQALAHRGLSVDFLGLIDVVKCTDDQTEKAISDVLQEFWGEKSAVEKARPAAAEVMRRAQSDPRAAPYAGMAAQGIISDAERREVQRDIAISNEVNRSPLPNAVSWGVGAFVLPGNVKAGFHARRDPEVGSRTYPMGHYPLEGIPSGGGFIERRDFFCTHSAMGGMPFRGDIPSNRVTRKGEWTGVRTVGRFIINSGNKYAIFSKQPQHNCMDSPTPPAGWYEHENIRSQYRTYLEKYLQSDGSGYDTAYENAVLKELQTLRMDHIRESARWR